VTPNGDALSVVETSFPRYSAGHNKKQSPWRIRMSDKNLAMIVIAATFMLAACSPSEPEAPAAAAPEPAEPAPAPAEAPAEPAPMSLADLLASDLRSEEDRARDPGRKPVDVLNFFGVEAGMDVVDLMAAGGWYSEVLSIAVGADGSVAAQNPPFILAFRDGANGIALDKRIGDRLTNVTRVDSSWAELAASGAQYDMALSALNFHDTYYLQSPEASAEFAAAVATVLKPGGVLGVIDHAGNPDGDNESMHRIDKALVIEIVTGAGLELEAESDMLANNADGHILGVFAEGMRGQTDRFVLKFRKPE
jgi:predicted methyltransferase